MSYGLDLFADLPTPQRLGVLARGFPGALPYVLFRHGERVGKFAAQEEIQAFHDCGGWSRRHLSDDGASMLYLLKDDAHTVEYGRVDWPEPRVVLVGEVNPYEDCASFDLYDQPRRSAGERLRTLVLGVRRETYFRRFARHNLCVGKWSAPAARKRAEELAREYPNGTFVLLGRKVQEAFEVRNRPAFDAHATALLDGEGVQKVVLLPHPSGRCRAWNDPGAIAKARRVLSLGCPGIEFGELT